jgi:phage FluMu protein Com
VISIAAELDGVKIECPKCIEWFWADLVAASFMDWQITCPKCKHKGKLAGFK